MKLARSPLTQTRQKWQSSFEKLYNADSSETKDVLFVNDHVDYNTDMSYLDATISIGEIVCAAKKAKKGKAVGLDGLPLEVLCNDTCISFLHKLFNICYLKGIFPEMWQKGVITPVPKSNTSNVYEPLSYRGITIASSSYKLFCSVLNNRLEQWVDENNILSEEQNGFRKNRSCIGHLTSLVNIVETRIRKKQNVFTAFFDFQKAYDSIDRNLLWSKLSNIGLVKHSKFMRAFQGIDANVEC